MQILWVLLYLITVAASILLVFFIFTIATKLGRFVGGLLSRFLVPLVVTTGGFLLLLIQEFTTKINARNAFLRHKDQSKQGQFFLTRLFIAGRNLQLALLGFVVFAGLLLITWQMRYWTRRNDGRRQELADLHRD
jgi:4-amino-4-deoxy-L-arabinose transferase-like glycosyltransferase